MPSIAEILKARAATRNAGGSVGAEGKGTRNREQGEGAGIAVVETIHELSPATKPGQKAPVVAGKDSPNIDKDSAEKLSEKIDTITKRSKEDEASKQAAALGLPTIALKGFPITADALTQLPEERAKELKSIVFFYDGPELRLGTTNPENPTVKELVFELEERLKTHVAIYFISDESFSQAMKLYATLPKIKPVIKGVEITEAELEKYKAQMDDLSSIAKLVRSASVTDVLAIVIAAAVKLASSDIHIEAEESGIAVRFRVDGMLSEVAKLERESWKKLISRLKLIASLKINVTDEAQDGRFTIFQTNKKIDVRVSTIPTAFGESVVMRLLNPDAIALEFDQLGFRPPVLKKLLKEIERPNGMVVTTGPTGSGKTTTLYAVLKRLNTPDVKIITLEDPIEYKVEGLNQSQIDHNREYTFAKGLRSILRQDPDIVMVGEIRDLETAEIAIQAALTGHLLFSTIHTNDAAGAIPRFLSMGVTPHLLAPAINAIMGQRLLRRLCKECKEPITLTEDLKAEVEKQLTSIPPASGEAPVDMGKVQFYGPKGCDVCNNTGYKGRVGAYEVLVKDPEVEKAVLKGTISEYDMREIAKTQGMVTMTQDGLLKAIDGLTSVDEVKRIAGL